MGAAYPAARCDPWRGFCVTDRRDTALPAASQPGSRADRIMWATTDLVRRHWMFWLLLAGGLVLRGPVFLFGLLAGIGGIFTFRRRRDSGPALACLLITGCAVAVLLSTDLYEFSWRYQLPALVTLPVAGAFGVTALVGFFRARAQAQARAQRSGVAAMAGGATEAAGAVEAVEPVGAMISGKP